LRESLLSEDSPPLTEQEAEILLSVPTKVKGSPAAIRKLRKSFVEKLFVNLHQEPVRDVKRGYPFGAWLKEAREKARLTREDIAESIGKDASFIERVESEQVLPWTLTPSTMANIVILFRIHIDAVAQLLSASFVADEERKLSQAMSTRPSLTSGVRAMVGGPGETPSNKDEGSTSDYLPMNEEIVRLLDKLRKILEQRQATHLL
jgi:transcriptional regulator with XRE-family HTH domain